MMKEELANLVLTFEAEAEDLDSDALITRVLDAVEVP